MIKQEKKKKLKRTTNLFLCSSDGFIMILVAREAILDNELELLGNDLSLPPLWPSDWLLDPTTKNSMLDNNIPLLYK